MSKVRLFSVLFAAMFAMTALFGCGGDSGGSVKPNDKFEDGRLAGTWEHKSGNDAISTITITGDGNFSMTSVLGVMEVKIATKGNSEIWVGGSKMFDYSISADGNTLTLDGVQYTRKTDNGNTGEGLILGANQAWTDEHEWPGEADGYIFMANGAYQAISNYCGVWEVNWESTYTVSANTLTLNNVMGMDIPSSVPFIIVDNNTLIINGDEYRVTENVTVVTEGGCENDEELLSKSKMSALKNRQKLKNFQ
ncbi:MAG: hypothetical protein FWE57_03410 [Chitinispirillia bacterium]|nr:hypothetical protein [Chitinispirillia bacterium]